MKTYTILLLSTCFVWLAYSVVPTLIDTTDTYSASAETTLTSQANTQDFGYGASAMGDVNGDGIDDLIVTSTYDNGAGTTNNYVYVIYGNAAGISKTLNINSMTPAQGYKISCNSGNTDTPVFATYVGDVNGDKIGDFVIVEPSSETQQAGTVQVVYGKSGVTTGDFDISALTDTTGVAFQSGSTIYVTGVIAAGDVNGDGYTDIAIGGGIFDGSDLVGGVAVAFGGKSLTSSTFGSSLTFPANQGTVISGGDTISILDVDIADVNDDGLDDIILSSATGNTVYIVYGSKTLSATVDVSALTSLQGVTINGFANGLGNAVGVYAVGDINADGIDDFAVSADQVTQTNGPTEAGMVYVLYGKKSWATINVATGWDSTLGFRVYGGNSGDNLAASIAGDADINNDGVNDLILSVPSNSLTTYEVVYVIYGQKGTTAVDVNLVNVLYPSQGLMIVDTTGGSAGDNFGTAVTVGDLNNDKRPDLVIGAPNYNQQSSPTSYGGVFIYYFGSASVTNCNQAFDGECITCSPTYIVNSTGQCPKAPLPVPSTLPLSMPQGTSGFTFMDLDQNITVANLFPIQVADSHDKVIVSVTKNSVVTVNDAVGNAFTFPGFIAPVSADTEFSITFNSGIPIYSLWSYDTPNASIYENVILELPIGSQTVGIQFATGVSTTQLTYSGGDVSFTSDQGCGTNTIANSSLFVKMTNEPTCTILVSQLVSIAVSLHLECTPDEFVKNGYGPIIRKTIADACGFDISAVTIVSVRSGSTIVDTRVTPPNQPGPGAQTTASTTQPTYTTSYLNNLVTKVNTGITTLQTSFPALAITAAVQVTTPSSEHSNTGTTTTTTTTPAAKSNNNAHKKKVILISVLTIVLGLALFFMLYVQLARYYRRKGMRLVPGEAKANSKQVGTFTPLANNQTPAPQVMVDE